MQTENLRTSDVAVVGGGLAGLTVATYLARAGQNVTIFEKAPEVGGRAATHYYGEFMFNQGPHALYRGGAASKILRDLEISFEGGVPNLSGLAIFKGHTYALPGGPISFVTNPLLSSGSKLKLASWLTKAVATHPDISNEISLRQWLENEGLHSDARDFLEAMARVFTYTNAPQDMSASAFLAQFKVALKNVMYLDGGWQTLVKGLSRAAQEAGVVIKSSSRVESVEDGKLLHLTDGKTFEADNTIIAGLDPAHAHTLIVGGNPALQDWANAVLPVQAACLDLGLRHLPKPEVRFAIGIDQPLYFSVHSAKAKLGPPNSVMLHVAKYLSPHLPTETKAYERELENMLDLLQPGWRNEVLERRFLPRMTVSNAVASAKQGGLTGRFGPQVPGQPNLYVVGDWVGPEGMLLDASLASARQAAMLILTQSVKKIVNGQSSVLV